LQVYKAKILLIGKKGQIGYELMRVLPLLGSVVGIDKEEVDMASPDSIIRIMREIKPNVVVNTAGYTSVDRAESEENLANRINGAAPGVIAEELKKSDGLMVHFSTDFAYDGAKGKPYNEKDPLNPLSVYGKSKIAGDNAIIASGVKHLIFRTSWVYGSRGRNFLLTMLDMCKNTSEISILNDQQGAPTWCRFLAEGVGLALSQKKAYDPAFSGFYNMSCGGSCTWYEFALAIAKYYEANYSKRIKIYPVSTGEYPMKALRPKYSVLDNHKLNSVFGVIMPDWNTSFQLLMQDMGFEEPKGIGVFPDKRKKTKKVEGSRL
jgi:dTDP-4-dehydrorhamnose reductase